MAVYPFLQSVLYVIAIHYTAKNIIEMLLEKVKEKLLEKIIEKLQEESRDDTQQEISKYLADRQLVCLLATAAGLHIAKKIAGYLVKKFIGYAVKISKKSVVVPIGIRLNYLLCYKSNIEGFRTQMKDLENARKNVLGRVDSAKKEDEVILQNVLDWLTNVDNIIEESTNTFEDELQLNLKWYYQLILKLFYQLNLKLYCQRSKYAKEKTADVVELTKKGNSFDRVSTNGLAYDSRKPVFKKIMEAVEDDWIDMIGIYGVRGVGKTTLAKQVQQQAEEGNLFDVVVMSLVSKFPDLKRIRVEIADMLYPKLDANTPSRRPQKPPKLFERLKKIKKFLIILDDVWKGFKLADTGIPFGKKHRGCKILLTSRSREVCDDCHVVNTTQKNFLIVSLN